MAALVKDCGGYRSSPIRVTHPKCNLSASILTRIPWPKAFDLFLGQRSEQHFSLSSGGRGANEHPISLQVLIIDKPVHDSTPDAAPRSKIQAHSSRTMI
jgi:hypothetical protein